MATEIGRNEGEALTEEKSNKPKQGKGLTTTKKKKKKKE